MKMRACLKHFANYAKSWPIQKLAIPAYIVLSDKTLHLLALKKPGDMEAFGEISGIGEFKKEKYGKDFLAVINEYLGRN